MMPDQEIAIDTTICRNRAQLEEHIDVKDLARFLHESLKPYEDPMGQIFDGLDYALSEEPGKGGFVLLAELDNEPIGVVVMLNTGMKGYIPENVLLFVAIRPDMRGKGLGGRIIKRALDEAQGDVKLHVEHDNPAKRLYERIGFTAKYTEMRYAK
ncbi:GNAT family N-acetyltransferase [Candidatus Fermentibacteria bacterium]|nr:GNAT family N-acetyltransferase [Candidatus Fermentibacteria bacterium]